MKKIVLLSGLIFTFLLITTNSVSAESPCSLDSSLINQDPHPAISGDYVKVLFQIHGTGGCDAGASAQLVLDYPFTLDWDSNIKTINSDTYAGEGTNSNWNIVYNLRIDENALEKDYELELRYNEGNFPDSNSYSYKKFNITIEDGRTDFEIHIENYKIKEREITFEILNTGNQDIEALTIEIPKQPNIVIKGSNRNIVGDLDSNEFTTTDFEAILSEGEITLDLYYTDSINERRMLQKKVHYDSIYFIDSLENKKSNDYVIYSVVITSILLVGFLIIKRKINKKNSKKRRKFSI